MHTKLIAIALLSALSINCLACSDDKAPATGDTDKDDARFTAKSRNVVLVFRQGFGADLLLG